MDMQNSHSNSFNNNLFSRIPDFTPQESIVDEPSEAPLVGADIDGLLTLFMNNKNTRQLAKKMAQYNSAAVLGALSYKAQENWSIDLPLHKVEAITEHDVTMASPLPDFIDQATNTDTDPLIVLLIKAMVAAAKPYYVANADEREQLIKSAHLLGFNMNEINLINDLLNQEITVLEIAASVSLDKHKSAAYLAAYFAVRDNNLIERGFLSDLASAMQLPIGLTTYLEQQANLGIINR